MTPSPGSPEDVRGASWADAVGSVHTAEEFAAALGVSVGAVDELRAAGNVLALDAGDQWVYPALQVSAEGRVITGLAEILAGVGETVDQWTFTSWMRTSRHAELGGRTVVEHLVAGGDTGEAVVAVRRSASRWSR